jgi:hypothetical protein
MPNRSGKGKVVRFRKQRDANQMARSVMEHIERAVEEQPGKNPAAVALGRQGGLKGGRARMDNLSPEQRRQLALKGARARWGKPRAKR